MSQTKVTHIGSKVRGCLQEALDANPDMVMLVWKKGDAWSVRMARVPEINFPFLGMIGQCEYMKSLLVEHYADDISTVEE